MTTIMPMKDIRQITDRQQSIQSRIFRLMLRYPRGLNIRQIAQRLRIDKSCASARLNELRSFERITWGKNDYTIIPLHRSRDGLTNKTVFYWGVQHLDNTEEDKPET